MSFEARIFIQGVANFIPHEDGTRLLALFPNQELYQKHLDGQPEPAELCRHFPMVQMDSRHLTGTGFEKIEAPWSTIHLDRQWVGFEVDGKSELMDLSKTLKGIPNIEDLLADAGLEAFAGLRPSLLPVSGDLDPKNDDHLVAGLYLEAGKVSMASDFTGSVRFHSLRDLAGPETRGRPAEEELAKRREIDEESHGNTLKVELGSIEGLTLKLRRFGSGEVRSIPLRPLGDTLDVWVRYFCEVERPVPKCPDEDSEAGDRDFLLNYLLRDDLEGLLGRADELVIPRITTSWLKGRPVGSDCVRCCGSGGNGGNFSPPI